MTTIQKPKAKRKSRRKVYKKPSAPKKDVYEIVNEKILENIDKGVLPWVKPWKSGENIPISYATNKTYSGVNFFSLAEKEYIIPIFLTYNEIRKQKIMLKKEYRKGNIIVSKFFRTIERKVNGEIVEDKIFGRKPDYVYSVSQLEELPKGIEALRTKVKERFENLKIDSFVKSLSVNMDSIMNRACYIVNSDVVNMPPLSSFSDENDYYAVMFHEMVHWTGHSSRLDRDLSGTMGDEKYAFEELIAELGSAYLCAIFGIDNTKRDSNTKTYLNGYGKMFKDKPMMYGKASSRAKKAVDFLLLEADMKDEVYGIAKEYKKDDNGKS